MRFIHSATATLLLKGLAMASGLGASVLIARVLGPTGRGVYALIMSVLVLSTTLGLFGLNAANTYFIGRDRSRARGLGVQSLLAGIAGGVLTTAIVVGVRIYFPSALDGLSDRLLWLTVLLVPLFIWGSLFSFAFLGLDRVYAFNAFETGQRLLFWLLGGVFLWVLSASMSDYITSVVVAVAILVAVLVIRFFLLAPAGRRWDPDWSGQVLRYGIRPYMATLLSLAIMRSAVLYINARDGNAIAGQFAVAQQLAELLLVVPSIIGTVLFARTAQGTGEELAPRVMRVMTWALLPVALLLMWMADWLITGVFGSAFAPAAPALRIMVPGTYLLGLQIVLANDLAGRGYPWPAVLVWVPALVIAQIGFALSIPTWSMYGASAVLTTVYIGVFIYMIAYYRRLTGTKLSTLFMLARSDFSQIRCSLRPVPGAPHDTEEHAPASLPH